MRQVGQVGQLAVDLTELQVMHFARGFSCVPQPASRNHPDALRLMAMMPRGWKERLDEKVSPHAQIRLLQTVRSAYGSLNVLLMVSSSLDDEIPPRRELPEAMPGHLKTVSPA